MSLIDNIDDVAFTTSLDNDKILRIFTGQLEVTGSSATRTIPQSFGASVLPVMIFSNDGLVWQDAGTPISTGSTLTPVMEATCGASSTDILLSVSNSSGSPQTCYYNIALISED